MTPVRGLVAALALAAVASPVSVRAADPAASAPARAHARTRAAAAVPAANFLVEWRVQPLNPAARRGDVVVTSHSAAAGGTSGFGPGAVVVGTARAAAPQSLRVANGREGAIRFDEAQARTVYDLSWAAGAESQSSTDASSSAAGATGASRASARSRAQGAAAHEATVHRVEGLRVTPHWTRGDSLALDVEIVRSTPAGLAGDGARAVAFSSTVQLSFDEWQSVATVGDGGEELQLRVSWR